MFGIILGLLCFASFLFGNNDKLLIPVSSLFLVKYFIVIAIINGGIFFIIFGSLNYIGILVPYYSEGITKHEKAKNHLFGIILLMPFWLSFLTTIFIMSELMLWKVLGSLALLYIGWLLFSSVKVLKGHD
jgi:hypothetical protein